MRVRLSPVASASMLLALSPCAFAQSAAQAPTQVVVVGTRVPVPRTQSLSDVVVVDADQLRSAAGQSIEDVLRDYAGVQLSRTGGPGHTTGVFIRGSSMSNVVVMVDGVRVGSASLGQASLEALNLDAVERIEVLRGPGSTLYGADAVGGVVQIITRKGQSGAPRGQASIHVGGYDSTQAQASLSGVQSAVDYAVAASRERSGGVSAVANPADPYGRYNPDADGFLRMGLSGQVGVTPAAGHRIAARWLSTRLRSQFDSAEYLPPTFTPDPSADFRNRQDTHVGAMSYSADLGAGLQSELTLSQSTDEVTSGASTTRQYDTRRRQLSWQPSVTIAPGTSVVGLLELNRVRVASAVFGAEPLKSRSRAVAASLIHGWSAQRVQVDVRHDKHQVYGAQTTGKLAYAWDLASDWQVRAALGSAFRAPSFNDLYYPGYGVDTLRPEKAQSTELGLAWRTPGASVRATWFDNRVRDLIGYQANASACPPGYTFGCASNVSRARLHGVSLEAQARVDAWRARVGAEFLDAKDNTTGQRLTRRAAHTATAQLGYDASSWGAKATVNAVGRRPEGGVQLSAYELLDLGAYWQFAPQWRLEAKLLNALNERYEPAKDYGALGRQAWIGVRLDTAGL